ncbi:transcriptional regulator, TetR family [Lacrimispora sphenoides]|jgi:AcrR family transcriptional regulator|uniref:TetR/AcrR family transcriptional regulator n=1 Tax=Lacrimispora sphenoides TaxID=29370 RepID=UPI00044BB2D0|nr:TetR/AcrR family transcriptional regulator [Lacrimispora sphenoides]EXG86745.1 transcriptional regulator, TetR family [Clostridium sp. ASBs410]SEU30006.1 transcriptional regulator, TetR family [Lacrimispora sphenoides]
MAEKGRPRSEKTEKAILAAAYKLLMEDGFQSVTVDSIAKEAGVSKATIYKWWPNKASVVADSFFAAAQQRIQTPDTGSVEKDLLLQLGNLSDFLETDRGRVITELIAQGQFDQDVANAYRTRYFAPRRLEAREILQRGLDRGELKKDMNIELSIDLIFAPLFYRMLVTGAEVDSDFIKNVVFYVLTGIKA